MDRTLQKCMGRRVIPSLQMWIQDQQGGRMQDIKYTQLVSSLRFLHTHHTHPRDSGHIHLKKKKTLKTIKTGVYPNQAEQHHTQ